MKKNINVSIIETRRDANFIIREVLFEDRRIFFEIRGSKFVPEIGSCDFAVYALIFAAMRGGFDIYIDGNVTTTLLRNIEEFQEAWASWFPQQYQPINVTSRYSEVDKSLSRKGVFAFSGGVDGTYALLRHLNGQAGRRNIKPVATMLVHGFDIPLSSGSEAFITAQANAEATMRHLDLPLFVVRTNWKDVACGNWEMEFGAALASCLHQFTGMADFGVLGSDEDYPNLVLPWGSNPVTNHFLSGGGFEIFTEGAGFGRTKRVALICESPEIARNLRVCWEGPITGSNCGRCEKCVRTKLNFMANKSEPICFDRRPTIFEILKMRAKNEVQISYLWDIIEVCKENKLHDRWVLALKIAYAKNKLFLPFWVVLRKVFHWSKKILSKSA